MSNVKFIVPADHTKAGKVVEVVEADAASFDELGWERAGKEEKQTAISGHNKKK